MPAAATAATTEIVVTVTWETFSGELRLGHGGQWQCGHCLSLLLAPLLIFISVDIWLLSKQMDCLLVEYSSVSCVYAYVYIWYQLSRIQLSTVGHKKYHTPSYYRVSCEQIRLVIVIVNPKQKASYKLYLLPYFCIFWGPNAILFGSIILRLNASKVILSASFCFAQETV